ncbi:hypothetical protein [Psychroserpens sp. Hel_I_66]|uniref:hypothetical protein n=1 Tax=Psychroserpens sp. Hel_I_66 TaxID=1250004 RepID=UPI00064635D6|nr:hypothetical protein [Psychroserpens sp. Hel_I_66]
MYCATGFLGFVLGNEFLNYFFGNVNALFLGIGFLVFANVFVLWLVALVGTNLVKENEPEENSENFPSTHKTSN